MFISAARIHNGKEWLPKGASVHVDQHGTITEVLLHTPDGATVLPGILCPGFVNVHCHTELSHIKGVILEHAGLIPFLQQVTQHRNDHTTEQKSAARVAAATEMYNNGIVAVGDIANTTDSMDVRAAGKLHFHTFIESIGFTEANAERSFGFALKTYEAFAAQPAHNTLLRQSITPHAPYSVSAALFRLIDAHTGPGILAIHNQESEAEGHFYAKKEGAVRNLLSALGIDDSLFQPTGMSSIRSYLQWLSNGRPFIFVHNTYTAADDVEHVHNTVKHAFWCLCPGANLYIENRLPDVQMLRNAGADICMGTDSLASNHRLCILSELVDIKNNVAGIDWEELLRWATYNGARALQMDNILGTIEPGKQPGLVHIQGLETGKPTAERVAI